MAKTEKKEKTTITTTNEVDTIPSPFESISTAPDDPKADDTDNAPRGDMWATLIKCNNRPLDYTIQVTTAEYIKAVKALSEYNEAPEDELATYKLKLKEALSDLNKLILSEQVDNVCNSGICAYLSNPYYYEVVTKKNKETGELEFITKVKQLFPSKVGDKLFVAGKGSKVKGPEGKMTIVKGWRECFKALAAAQGTKYFFSLSDDEKPIESDVLSMREQKDALNDCIKAVLGEHCGLGARRVDVEALAHSIRTRTEGRGEFLKVKQGLYFWAIIDGIAIRATNANYKLIDKKE